MDSVITDASFIKDVIYTFNPSDATSPLSLVLEKGEASALSSLLASLTASDYKENIAKALETISDRNAEKYLRKILSCPFNERIRKPYLVLDRSTASQRPFILETHPSAENL